MSGSKTNTFLKGLSVQTIMIFVMGILEIVVFSIMSRLLTKSDFGYYAALNGIIAIGLSLSESGLGATTIQKKDASPMYLSTVFSLSIIIGFLGSAIIFICAPFLAGLVADSTLVLPIRIMSISLLLNCLISVGNAVLYRDLKFKKIGLVNCTSYICSSAIGLILAYNRWGLLAIVTLHLLHSLITTIILYSIYVKIPKIKIERSEISGIFSFGGWLTLSVFVNNLTQQLDKLLLSKWISVESLGSYNRPAGFVSQISSKINSIFDTVLFPMLSNLQDDAKRVCSTFFRAIGLLNSFSVTLACMFYFNAELIIQIFFGIQWQELVPIMKIVSISVIFNINGRLVDCFFRSLNLVKLNFYIRIFGAILTLCCLFIGSKYGIIGVSIGLVISNIVVVILKVLVLAKRIKANLNKVFLTWAIAWRPAFLIIIIASTMTYFSNHTIAYNCILLFCCLLILLLEFVLCPKMVGDSYYDLTKPYFNNLLRRMKK